MSTGCAADQRMSARRAAGESAIVDHSRLRDCRICATESLLVSLSTTRFRGLHPTGPPARPPVAQDLWISGSRFGPRAPARPPVRPVSGSDAGRRRALQPGGRAYVSMEPDQALCFTPVSHPDARVQRVGFDLTDPYVEQCWRSEEHTSELQSLMRISYAVFCLKKKKATKNKQLLNSKS